MKITKEHLKQYKEIKKQFSLSFGHMIKNIDKAFCELAEIVKENNLQLTAESFLNAAKSSSSIFNKMFDFSNTTEEAQLQYAFFIVSLITMLIDSDNNVYVLKGE
jgi:hypothetical protein